MMKKGRRISGGGGKQYAFIEKAFEIAIEYPGFFPNYSDIALLNEEMCELEDLQHLSLSLLRFSQMVDNVMRLKSNDCYHAALGIFFSLQSAARSNLPKARKPYRTLKPFFKKGGKPHLAAGV